LAIWPSNQHELPVSSVQRQTPGVRIPRSIPARYAALSRLCGVGVLLLGLVVLAGWAFDIPRLKSVLPGLVSMKANTALGFILSGLALWLKAEGGKRKAERGISLASVPSSAFPFPRSLIANLCALAVALLGAATLGEYLFGFHWMIDDLLFTEAPGAVLTLHPGRMAPITALNFVLLGVALLMLDVELRRGGRPAQYLTAGSGLIALQAFVGYVYGSSAFYFGFGRGDKGSVRESWYILHFPL